MASDKRPAPVYVTSEDGSGPNTIGVASVTRPADTTAYAIGDLIANSVTAGSVVPIALNLGRAALLRRLRLKKSSASLTNASYRVHLYRNLPTVTVGDNGVLNNAGVMATTESDYLGSVDIVMDRAFSDGAKGFGVPGVGSELTTDTVTIYALIEARAAYTPASGEVFTLVAEGI